MTPHVPRIPSESPRVLHMAQTAEETRIQNEEMAYDIEKLFMITEALWSIIKKQNGLKDDDLIELINDIDKRSGKADGRRAKEERPNCPQCNRKIMARNTVCLYCGTVAKLNPFKRY